MFVHVVHTSSGVESKHNTKSLSSASTLSLLHCVNGTLVTALTVLCFSKTDSNDFGPVAYRKKQNKTKKTTFVVILHDQRIISQKSNRKRGWSIKLLESIAKASISN